MEHLSDYCRAVSARVCLRCIDSDSDGRCRLTQEQQCALIVHFPKIVATIFSVESDRLEPYVDALRKNVCASCSHQSAEGSCTLRNHVDCGLDRYFPMIVNIIQQSRLEFDSRVEAFGD